MNIPKRRLYIDVINIISCLAVIILHHNSMVHTFEDTLNWKISLGVECGFYWAVPVFLMLSGVTLLNYREKYDTRTFFEKRIRRTVIPWLFWSVILLLWKLATDQLNIEAQSGSDLFIQVFNLLFNNKIESTYWFFGALFACYLTMPVFSMIANARRTLWYVVILNFIFLSSLPLLNVWFGLSFSLDIPIVGSLIIYVILGYLLDEYGLSRRQRWIVYGLGLFGLLFRYVYTLILSINTEVTDTSIKGYVRFHSVFLSVAVFVFLKHVDWEKVIPGKIREWLPIISSCSFGIFLIHKVIMYYERATIGLFEINTKSIIWRVGFVPVTYIVCLVCVMIMKRIPGIKKMMG